MAYDRLGRIVKYLETVAMDGTTITNSFRTFTYDGYLQIANTEHVTGVSQSFIWDPTEPIATRPLVFRQTGTPPQFYTHDGAKNISGLAFSDLSFSVCYEYPPYGTSHQHRPGSHAMSNPFGFSSEYSDGAIGIQYYNYRHYIPKTGRWSGRDREASVNLYSFNCNRYGATDTLGLWSFWGRDCFIYSGPTFLQGARWKVLRLIPVEAHAVDLAYSVSSVAVEWEIDCEIECGYIQFYFGVPKNCTERKKIRTKKHFKAPRPVRLPPNISISLSSLPLNAPAPSSISGIAGEAASMALGDFLARLSFNPSQKREIQAAIRNTMPKSVDMGYLRDDACKGR